MASEDSELGRRIGREIRRLRTEQDLTQRELAERAGVAQQNLSLYERGDAAPRLGTLERILDSLDAELVIRRKGAPEARLGTRGDVSVEEVRDLIRRLVDLPEKEG